MHTVLAYAVLRMGRGPGRDYGREPWLSVLGPRPKDGEALSRWNRERRRVTQAWRRAGILPAVAVERPNKMSVKETEQERSGV